MAGGAARSGDGEGHRPEHGRWHVLLLLPLLAGGAVAAFLLWLPVHVVVGEYRPAWTGQDWNTDVSRPRPETWPYAVVATLLGAWVVYLLATGLRDQVRWRRVAAGLLLAGVVAVAGRAVVDHPVQRCAQDVYAGDPDRVCIGGRQAAAADVLVLLPTIVPVLALALPNGARQRGGPSARLRHVLRPADPVA